MEIKCPDNTSYGERGFGRPDVATNDLVCDGSIVKAPTLYNNKELPSTCTIEKSTCSPQTNVCYSISCKGTPCVLNVVSTERACTRSLNMSSCDCPTDRNGPTCSEYEPLIWSSSVTSPRKKTVQQDPKEARLVYDRSLFSVSVGSDQSFSVSVMVNCSFVNKSKARQPGNFSYWINSESLLVHEDPSWALQAKIYNFNSMSNGGRVYRTTLTSQNILGKKVVTFTVPFQDLTSDYVYGGRAYMEIGFGDENYPPGFKNSQLQRLFFDVLPS